MSPDTIAYRLSCLEELLKYHLTTGNRAAVDSCLKEIIAL